MPEGFVPAHDPITGEDLMVPAHFVGEHSPFPHLQPIDTEAPAVASAETAAVAGAETPAANQATGNRKPTGAAGADNPKE